MGKFEELYKIDVNNYKEDRDGLSYLSWSWAWAEFKKRCPDANYEVWRDEQGRPYIYDESLGYMVFCKVTAEGETHEMWLPVMDSKNKAMKSQPYTYMTKYSKEMTVNAATMFDINKTIMRCMVKCIGMFGLGLYIYAGEDLPEVGMITGEQIQKILLFCTDNRINAGDICALYKVSKLENLTEKQWNNINAHWDDLKAKFCK